MANTNETLKKYTVEIVGESKQLLDTLNEIEKKANGTLKNINISGEIESQVKQTTKKLKTATKVIGDCVGQMNRKMESLGSVKSTSNTTAVANDVMSLFNTVLDKMDDVQSSISSLTSTGIKDLDTNFTKSVTDINTSIDKLNSGLQETVKYIQDVRAGAISPKDMGLSEVELLLKEYSKLTKSGSKESLLSILSNKRGDLSEVNQAVGLLDRMLEKMDEIQKVNPSISKSVIKNTRNNLENIRKSMIDEAAFIRDGVQKADYDNEIKFRYVLGSDATIDAIVDKLNAQVATAQSKIKELQIKANIQKDVSSTLTSQLKSASKIAVQQTNEWLKSADAPKIQVEIEPQLNPELLDGTTIELSSLKGNELNISESTLNLSADGSLATENTLRDIYNVMSAWDKGGGFGAYNAEQAQRSRIDTANGFFTGRIKDNKSIKSPNKFVQSINDTTNMLYDSYTEGNLLIDAIKKLKTAMGVNAAKLTGEDNYAALTNSELYSGYFEKGGKKYSKYGFQYGKDNDGKNIKIPLPLDEWQKKLFDVVTSAASEVDTDTIKQFQTIFNEIGTVTGDSIYDLFSELLKITQKRTKQIKQDIIHNTKGSYVDSVTGELKQTPWTDLAVSKNNNGSIKFNLDPSETGTVVKNAKEIIQRNVDALYFGIHEGFKDKDTGVKYQGLDEVNAKVAELKNVQAMVLEINELLNKRDSGQNYDSARLDILKKELSTYAVVIENNEEYNKLVERRNELLNKAFLDRTPEEQIELTGVLSKIQDIESKAMSDVEEFSREVISDNNSIFGASISTLVKNAEAEAKQAYDNMSKYIKSNAGKLRSLFENPLTDDEQYKNALLKKAKIEKEQGTYTPYISRTEANGKTYFNYNGLTDSEISRYHQNNKILDVLNLQILAYEEVQGLLKEIDGEEQDRIQITENTTNAKWKSISDENNKVLTRGSVAISGNGNGLSSYSDEALQELLDTAQDVNKHIVKDTEMSEDKKNQLIETKTAERIKILKQHAVEERAIIQSQLEHYMTKRNLNFEDKEERNRILESLLQDGGGRQGRKIRRASRNANKIDQDIAALENQNAPTQSINNVLDPIRQKINKATTLSNELDRLYTELRMAERFKKSDEEIQDIRSKINEKINEVDKVNNSISSYEKLVLESIQSNEKYKRREFLSDILNNDEKLSNYMLDVKGYNPEIDSLRELAVAEIQKEIKDLDVSLSSFAKTLTDVDQAAEKIKDAPDDKKTRAYKEGLDSRVLRLAETKNHLDKDDLDVNQTVDESIKALLQSEEITEDQIRLIKELINLKQKEKEENKQIKDLDIDIKNLEKEIIKDTQTVNASKNASGDKKFDSKISSIAEDLVLKEYDRDNKKEERSSLNKSVRSIEARIRQIIEQVERELSPEMAEIIDNMISGAPMPQRGETPTELTKEFNDYLRQNEEYNNILQERQTLINNVKQSERDKLGETKRYNEISNILSSDENLTKYIKSRKLGGANNTQVREKVKQDLLNELTDLEDQIENRLDSIIKTKYWGKLSEIETRSKQVFSSVLEEFEKLNGIRIDTDTFEVSDLYESIITQATHLADAQNDIEDALKSSTNYYEASSRLIVDGYQNEQSELEEITTLLILAAQAEIRRRKEKEETDKQEKEILETELARMNAPETRSVRKQNSDIQTNYNQILGDLQEEAEDLDRQLAEAHKVQQELSQSRNSIYDSAIEELQKELSLMEEEHAEEIKYLDVEYELEQATQRRIELEKELESTGGLDRVLSKEERITQEGQHRLAVEREYQQLLLKEARLEEQLEGLKTAPQEADLFEYLNSIADPNEYENWINKFINQFNGELKNKLSSIFESNLPINEQFEQAIKTIQEVANKEHETERLTNAELAKQNEKLIEEIEHKKVLNQLAQKQAGNERDIALSRVNSQTNKELHQQQIEDLFKDTTSSWSKVTGVEYEPIAHLKSQIEDLGYTFEYYLENNKVFANIIPTDNAIRGIDAIKNHFVNAVEEMKTKSIENKVVNDDSGEASEEDIKNLISMYDTQINQLIAAKKLFETQLDEVDEDMRQQLETNIKAIDIQLEDLKKQRDELVKEINFAPSPAPTSSSKPTEHWKSQLQVDEKNNSSYYYKVVKGYNEYVDGSLNNFDKYLEKFNTFYKTISGYVDKINSGTKTDYKYDYVQYQKEMLEMAKQLGLELDEEKQKFKLVASSAKTVTDEVHNTVTATDDVIKKIDGKYVSALGQNKGGKDNPKVIPANYSSLLNKANAKNTDSASLMKAFEDAVRVVWGKLTKWNSKQIGIMKAEIISLGKEFGLTIDEVNGKISGTITGVQQVATETQKSTKATQDLANARKDTLTQIYREGHQVEETVKSEIQGEQTVNSLLAKRVENMRKLQALRGKTDAVSKAEIKRLQQEALNELGAKGIKDKESKRGKYKGQKGIYPDYGKETSDVWNVVTGKTSLNQSSPTSVVTQPSSTTSVSQIHDTSGLALEKTLQQVLHKLDTTFKVEVSNADKITTQSNSSKQDNKSQSSSNSTSNKNKSKDNTSKNPNNTLTTKQALDKLKDSKVVSQLGKITNEADKTVTALVKVNEAQSQIYNFHRTDDNKGFTLDVKSVTTDFASLERQLMQSDTQILKLNEEIQNSVGEHKKDLVDRLTLEYKHNKALENELKLYDRGADYLYQMNEFEDKRLENIAKQQLKINAVRSKKTTISSVDEYQKISNKAASKYNQYTLAQARIDKKQANGEVVTAQEIGKVIDLKNAYLDFIDAMDEFHMQIKGNQKDLAEINPIYDAFIDKITTYDERLDKDKSLNKTLAQDKELKQEQKLLDSYYNARVKSFERLQKLKRKQIKENDTSSETRAEIVKAQKQYDADKKAYNDYVDDLKSKGHLLNEIAEKLSLIRRATAYEIGITNGARNDSVSSDIKEKLSLLTEYQDRVNSLRIEQARLLEDDPTGNYQSYTDEINKLNIEIQRLTNEINRLKLTEQEETLVKEQNNKAGRKKANTDEEIARIQRKTDYNSTTKALKEQAGAYDDVAKALRQSIQRYTGYALGVSKIVSSIRNGINYLKQFDQALTTISYTMDISQSKLKDMGDGVINLAKELSTSTENAFNVAQIYANMNTSVEDIMETSKPTLVLSNLTGTDASTAADQIQAVMQQFELTAEQSEHIVDVYDHISKNIAVDYSKGIQGMSEAVQVAGATAKAAGLEFEQLSAITAKVMEQTRQAGSQVGNGLKTIFTRLSKANKISDEEVDNETLSKASQSLNEIGIQVYKANGEYRQFDVIMGELAAKWDGLTDAQKANISYNVAATRQTNLLSAVLKNYSSSMSLATEAANTQGNALENQSKYTESYVGKLQALSTQWETFWIHLLDSDGFKTIVELLTKLVDTLDKVVVKAGSLPSIMTILGFGSFNSIINELGQHGFNLSDMFSELFKKEQVNETTQTIRKVFEGLDDDFENMSDSLLDTLDSTNKKAQPKLKGFQTMFAGVGKAIKSSLVNIGISAGIGLIIGLVTKAVTSIKNYQAELRHTISQVNETFSSNIKSLDSYEQQIIQINDVLEDHNSSVEEVAQAHIDLSNIQNEIIQQFGQEASAIDLTTGSIEQQIDAINNLKKIQFDNTVSDINSTNSGFWNNFKNFTSKELGYMFSLPFGIGRQKYYEDQSTSKNERQRNMTEFQKQIDDYNNYEVLIRATDENIRNLLKNNGFSKAYGNVYSITDDVYTVSTLLEKIQTQANSIENVNGKFVEDLAKAKEDASSLVNNFGNLADQEYYYNTIGSNDFNKQQADQIANLYQSYKNATSAVSKETALNDLRNNLTENIQYAISKGDEELANWYKRMYSDVLTVQVKIEPLLNTQLNGSEGTVQNGLDYAARLFNQNNTSSETLSQLARKILNPKDIDNLETGLQAPFSMLQKIATETEISISELINYMAENGLIYDSQELTIKAKFPEHFDEIAKWSPEVKKIAFSTSWDGKSWDSWNREVNAKLKQNIEDANKGSSTSYMIKNLSDLSDTFEKVDAAYAEFFDKNNAWEGVGLDKMNNLINALEKIEGFDLGSVEKQLTNISNAKNAKDAKESFNELADALINQSRILDKVTDDTEANTIATLKTLGVENAETIVTEALTKNKERLALEEQFVTSQKKTLAEATVEEIQAFVEEDNKITESEQELIKLKIAQLELNANSINTSESINQLKELAKQAGATTASIQNLAKASLLQGQIESKQKSLALIDTSTSKGYYEYQQGLTQIEKWNSELTEKLNEPIEYNEKKQTKINYIGGQGTADKIKSAADAGASEFSEYIDFYEKKIKELQDGLDLLTASIENLSGAAAKNKLLSGKTTITQAMLAEENKRLEYYTKKSEELLQKVPAAYRELAKNGGELVAHLTGEEGKAIKKAIDDYQEYADKVDEVNVKIQELTKSLAELAKQRFDNVVQDFKEEFDIFSKTISTIQSQIALIEESGNFVGKAFYETMRGQAEKQLEILEAQKGALATELQNALKSGVKVGSEEWVAMVSTMQELDKEIIDTKKSVEEFDNALIKLHWDVFDKVTERLDNLKSEISNINSIIDDKDAFDESGNWTSKGYTKLGMYAQEYERASYASVQYGNEIEQLNKDFGEGKYSALEYAEKLAELNEKQWGEVQNAENAKKAIVSLNAAHVDAVEDGLKKQIDAYKEHTNALIENLQAQKDLKNWQDSLADKTKNVTNIEKQLAAMAGDDSAEANAKRKKLEAQLASAQKDLDNSVWEHSIDEQIKGLQDSVTGMEKDADSQVKALRKTLEDEEKVVADSFELVKKNTGAVLTELTKMSETYGVNISSEITKAWASGSTAIGDYKKTLTDSGSTFKTELSNTQQGIYQLATEADTSAKALAAMYATSGENLYATLLQGRTDLGNTTLATNTLNNALKSTLEGNFDVSGITGALNSIQGAAEAAAKAINSIPAAPSVDSSARVEMSGGKFVAKDGSGAVVGTYNNAEDASKKVAKLNKHATGVHKLKKGEIAWTQEEGLEAILSPTTGSVLTPLKKGDSVLTAEQTENLFKLAQFSPKQLMGNTGTNGIVAPINSANQTTNNVSYDSLITINGDVNDTEHFLGQIQNVAEKAINKTFKDINMSSYKKGVRV